MDLKLFHRGGFWRQPGLAIEVQLTGSVRLTPVARQGQSVPMTPHRKSTAGGVRLTTAPPEPLNQQQTIEDLLIRAKWDAVPIRNDFVQQGRGAATRPGPLAEFVRSQDLRGLHAYLLVRAFASSKSDRGWDCTLDADTWIRALNLRATTTPDAARSAVSKAFGRSVKRALLSRERVGRKSSLVVLREDGSGLEYTNPGTDREPYFKLPHTFWTDEHYKTLTLPGIAVLLIALSLPDEFILPSDQGKAWYGIGADSIAKGLRELAELEVLDYRTEWVVNARAKDGYQSQRYYKLIGPYSAALRASKKVTVGTGATAGKRLRRKATAPASTTAGTPSAGTTASKVMVGPAAEAALHSKYETAPLAPASAVAEPAATANKPRRLRRTGSSVSKTLSGGLRRKPKREA